MASLWRTSAVSAAERPSPANPRHGSAVRAFSERDSAPGRYLSRRRRSRVCSLCQSSLRRSAPMGTPCSVSWPNLGGGCFAPITSGQFTSELWFRGGLGAHTSSRGGSDRSGRPPRRTNVERDLMPYLNCSRCGLSVRIQAEALAMNNCPRCLARNQLVWPLELSQEPRRVSQRSRPSSLLLRSSAMLREQRSET